MKVAEAVVSVLQEQEARYIYGIPGGQTLFFTDALLKTEIEFIPTRHEGVAAAAADGWGRLTGKPGLCLATTGPGATSLITSLGGALRDSSPVIAFVFQNKTADIGRGDAQEANHEALFSSIVKKYIPVRHASNAVWAMREAYRTAMTGRKGPVVVDFYRDVIEQGECDYVPLNVENYCVIPNFIPEMSSINKVVDILTKHQKVCIWAGGGVKTSRSGSKIIAMAEKLIAPVVTTYNGIGCVSSNHRLVFGPRSRHGSQVTKNILESADCVLIIGSSLSGITTNRWSLKLKNVVQIDYDPYAIGKQYPVEFGLIGELSRTLDLINANLKNSNRKERETWINELIQEKADFSANLEKGPVSDPERTPASPIAVVKAINSQLKSDEIICVDAGNPGAWSHLLEYNSDGFYMKPVNYGNMGFSIGASLASSMAEPDREVLCLIGDGSLGMTLGDLETLNRFGNNVILIVLNDQAYGNIKQEELFKFGEGRYTGVDLSDFDYAKVAAAIGMSGETVFKAADIPQAIQNARKTNKPYMIEVKFDGTYTIWPELLPWA